MTNFNLPDLNEEKTVLKTIRIKYNMLKELEKIAIDNSMSVNRLINECINYALKNLEEQNVNSKTVS